MPSQENTVQVISIDLIDLNPDQSRQEYDDESLNDLAESIGKVGLINPINVVKVGDRYKLLAGSRRLKAHLLLRKLFIRASISEENSTEELAIMTHENLYRADLSPFEEATFYAKLIAEQNTTVEQLIHLTGKGESYVLSRLHLLQCSEKLQQYVHSGKLKISNALELQKFEKPEVIDQYTEYAVSTGASLQTIKYWRQQLEANGTVPNTADKPPDRLVNCNQETVFGWHCYSCSNFHKAQDMQTLHVCHSCFADMETAKHSAS